MMIVAGRNQKMKKLLTEDLSSKHREEDAGGKSIVELNVKVTRDSFW